MTSGDRSNPCRSLSPPKNSEDYRALDAEPKPEAALSCGIHCIYFAGWGFSAVPPELFPQNYRKHKNVATLHALSGLTEPKV